MPETFVEVLAHLKLVKSTLSMINAINFSRAVAVAIENSPQSHVTAWICISIILTVTCISVSGVFIIAAICFSTKGLYLIQVDTNTSKAQHGIEPLRLDRARERRGGGGSKIQWVSPDYIKKFVPHGSYFTGVHI